MNWITTNIRLPEDLYMDLKMSAAKERKSVAAVIRAKLFAQAQPKKKTNVAQMLEKLGTEIAKENKGLDLTSGLIQMRYEQ